MNPCELQHLPAYHSSGQQKMLHVRRHIQPVHGPISSTVSVGLGAVAGRSLAGGMGSDH